MGKCEYCGVTVRGSAACPLCGRKVRAQRSEKLYPDGSADSPKAKNKRLPFWQAAVTLSAVGVCAWVNLATRGSTGGYWCLDIAAVFAYLWVLVLHTVKSSAQGSLKLSLQALLVMAMLCVFDWNAGRGLWSVNFGVPIVCAGFILLATYIVVTRKMSWSGYIGYMAAVALFGQIPVVSVMLGLAQIAWPGIAAAGYAVFTFLVMLMFANGRYKNELVRRLRF